MHVGSLVIPALILDAVPVYIPTLGPSFDAYLGIYLKPLKLEYIDLETEMRLKARSVEGKSKVNMKVCTKQRTLC